jgi:hypothetical protein
VISISEVLAGIDYAKLIKVATLYIVNGLNQDVTIQVKGNRERTLTNAVNIGSAFTVSKGSSDSRTLTPDTSGWLPYITVSLSCSVAPTSGSVTIYWRRVSDEIIVVDTLAIRDTLTHDNSTNPDKIKIVDW